MKDDFLMPEQQAWIFQSRTVEISIIQWER